MTKLKPCPFCGEEAGIDEDDSYGLRYSISCFKGCGDGDLWFKTKDEAVLHWNTRPIEAAQQQRIDGLVEALNRIASSSYPDANREIAKAALKAVGVEQ